MLDKLAGNLRSYPAFLQKWRMSAGQQKMGSDSNQNYPHSLWF